MTRVLQGLSELLFLGMLAAFLKSPAALNPQHRILLVLLAVSLAIGSRYSVGRSYSSDTLRWLLVVAAGVALSLAVEKQNLDRPPGALATAAAVGTGICALTSAAICRWRVRRHGMETGFLAAFLIVSSILLLLFHPVASQNDLDSSVYRDAWHCLFSFLLMAVGVGITASFPRSLTRMSAMLSASMVIRLFLHHAGVTE